MVKFRISILLLCIILPPILYVGSVYCLERYAEKYICSGLYAAYLGDTQQLLDGSIKLQEAIRENVDRYLDKNSWLKWGGKATVTVQTHHNTLLYPLIYPGPAQEPAIDSTPLEIATENFSLINEGLELFLTFKLPHNTLITNLLLATLISIAVTALLLYFRHWRLAYHRQAALQSIELERLTRTKSQNRARMESLQTEYEHMAEAIREMKAALDKQKAKADTNEADMLDEIITLEDEITRKEALQTVQCQKIETLQAKLTQLKQPLQKKSSAKRNPLNHARKRLSTLYKNLDIHDRAVEGYLDLPEGLKLKCEEIIVQLNKNATEVQIKRKVFGKKSRVSVLEVVFGYKGRLYFIPKGDRHAELLVIGTKNSQQNDLAYLERL